RRFRTSESPSRRWLFTDMKRPVVKKTSSARAVRATSRIAENATTETKARGIVPASSASLFRFDERVKHADSELARVFAVGRRNQSLHKRLIDRYVQLNHAARPELRSGIRNLSEYPLFWCDRELV